LTTVNSDTVEDGFDELLRPGSTSSLNSFNPVDVDLNAVPHTEAIQSDSHSHSGFVDHFPTPSSSHSVDDLEPAATRTPNPFNAINLKHIPQPIIPTSTADSDLQKQPESMAEAQLPPNVLAEPPSVSSIPLVKNPGLSPSNKLPLRLMIAEGCPMYRCFL
jgi:hypothetical protein